MLLDSKLPSSLWAESQNCVHARIRHPSKHFNGADADPLHIGIDGCDISPEVDTAAQDGSRTAPLRGDGAETTGLNRPGMDTEAHPMATVPLRDVDFPLGRTVWRPPIQTGLG